MTEVFEPSGNHDRRLVAGAQGVLGELNRAGVLTAADVHVATTLGDVGGGIVVATLLVWAACSFVAGATLTIAAYAATHQ